MKKAIAAIAVIILAGGFLRVCVRKVPIDRVGIKIQLLGGGGVVQEDFHPGYVFCVPGVHKLELMDPTLQFLVMGPGGEMPSLSLRGSDQFLTQVDVTVVYRLKPKEAHKALVRHGLGDAFKNKLRSFAELSIWQELAKLDTEDFYNPEERLKGSTMACDRMNSELREQHMEVIDVLVRNVKYDPKFEEKLLAKQILDQRQQLETSKALLEKEKEKTDLIDKETDAKVLAINEELKAEINKVTAETDAKVAQIEADASLFSETVLAEAQNYERQRIAEGDLLKTIAKAKGEKAISIAYTGFGGKLYLARQMVENIEIGTIEINTNQVNPFDVGQMLKMLGVTLEDTVPRPPE